MSDSNNKFESQSEDSLLTDHDYDGIKELDNNLPNWWLFLFIGTIAFGVIYYAYYESGVGLFPAQELEIALAELESLKKGGPLYTEESLNSRFTEELSTQGLAIFSTKCAACHGSKGEGLIGPNLSDKSWIHGKGTNIDIVKIISNGAPEKGMPPWVDMLTEQELLSVAAYVASVRGTFIPGGKPAQGNEYP